ncbi:MAG: glycosyltransferase family 4 protein [Burkholderiaceae bacterium]|nr:glycosyltransferase family 4 protein [Burkholderiaceae bacterium]MEB2320551.1 glycosyltransferase family 4 protein [Pseudomonadota bacterium]
MRVLFFVRERHPTFRVDVTVLFGKFLSRLGVASDLVTLREPGRQVDWGGGEVFGPPASGGRFRINLAALLNDFRGLLRIGPRYDMVLVRDKPLFTLWAWLVSRLRGVPFAYWMSFPLPESALEFARERGPSIGLFRWLIVYGRGLLSYWTLYKVVLPRADIAFVQSDEMLRTLQARGIRMRHAVPVPMGVDREAIERIMARDDTDIEPTAADWLARARTFETVVYLGTVEENRRLELALEAFATVLRVRPEALLLIIGNADEPGDIEKLKTLARELGIASRVIFTGWLDMATAWQLVRAARVGFSPCPRGVLYDVASPTKAVEYMALGLPVVANDLPDQAFVIGRSGGGLCTPLEPDAFAAAMIELLSDPEAARRRGQAGRQWALENRNYDRLATLVRNEMLAVVPAGETERA